MVNCSHCGKELDREVFCSPSHKVMFHRNKSNIDTSKIAKKLLIIGDLKPIRMRRNKIVDNCKHGYPPYLCKYQECRK